MILRSACLCIAASLLPVLTQAEGSAPAKIVGFGANQQAAQPGGAGTVAAGLPDIMGTTLGFAVNGFTKWGSTTTIDQPNQVKATQAGAGKNLCTIGTGLYRTFNKGNIAAGSFIDVVYRNGAPIYTRHVASLAGGKSIDFKNHDLPFQEGMNVIQVKMDANNNVSESNESNTFEVKVIVKLDCNGDGIVAGMTPQVKNSSPDATPQTAPVRLPARRVQ